LPPPTSNACVFSRSQKSAWSAQEQGACNHNLDQYLEEWIAASELGTGPEAPLFPTLRHGRLTDRAPLPQANVHVMIQ
jgi:hypothetical protein